MGFNSGFKGLNYPEKITVPLPLYSSQIPHIYQHVIEYDPPLGEAGDSYKVSPLLRVWNLAPSDGPESCMSAVQDNLMDLTLRNSSSKVPRTDLQFFFQFLLVLCSHQAIHFSRMFVVVIFTSRHIRWTGWRREVRHRQNGRIFEFICPTSNDKYFHCLGIAWSSIRKLRCHQRSYWQIRPLAKSEYVQNRNL